VMDVLPKRFGKYGLTLHPGKTRLVSFRRPSLRAGPEGRERGSGAGTFDFLGFTHLWRRTRRGGWAIQQRTARGRLTRAIRRITEWCRGNRHRRVEEQHQVLEKKLKGHYEYYGLTWNSEMLSRFRYAVLGIWWKWLNRRSQRARMKWERYERLLGRFPLPLPIAVHSVCRPQRSRGPKSRMQ